MVSILRVALEYLRCLLLLALGTMLHLLQHCRAPSIGNCSRRSLVGHCRGLRAGAHSQLQGAEWRGASDPHTCSGRPRLRDLALLRALIGAQPVTTAAAARGQPKPAADDSEGPWLIVGLGNPGSGYADTRHNVGFMVVDALARAEGIDVRKLERGAAVGRGEVGGRRVILAKPVTFMNVSGEAVGALARFYKVPPGRVLVVSDDLDQPTGAVRLRQKGGHGGHNGLRSVIQHLGGTQEFPRIKIGIGRPAGTTPVASYVLQEFKRSEAAEIEAAVAESLQIINSIMSLGLSKALSGVRA